MFRKQRWCMGKQKDAYWFRHDSTAGRGLRLKKLQHKYGHWGKGVYWDIIEVLREQSGYKYEVDEVGLQMLCELIGVKDLEKFNEFFAFCCDLKLFRKKNGFFSSETLIKNMKKWESSKSNGSKGGRPKKKKIENPIETQPVTQTKANGNHNIIGEDINNRIEIKPPANLIESFLKDLPNSTALENMTRTNSIPKDKFLDAIPEFQKHTRTSYKDFNDFADHFKFWYLKNVSSTQSVKLKTSYK